MTPPHPASGPGSRGGNVRSVEHADALHKQHKEHWTARVRAHMANTLLTTGFFHIDDLDALDVPEAHCNIKGSQVSAFRGSKWMVRVGERKVEHPAANARKAGIYKVTDLGRQELPKEIVGLDAGVPNPQGPAGVVGPSLGTSVESSEPVPLFPDASPADRPLSAFTDQEAA